MINSKHKLLYFLIALSFPLLIYFDSLGDYFISDDFSLILAGRENALFLSFFSTANNPQWHYSPLLLVVFYLEFLLFGMNPFWWHLVTLLCHGINSLLVYLLAGKVTKNETIALVSSIIFASYYLHYESVIWISGLHTSLMVLFYLLSLFFFIKYMNRRKTYYYCFAFIFFSMSLLTKEESITLVVIFLLYDFIFFESVTRGKSFHENLKESVRYIPFILIALIFSVVANRGTFKPHLIENILHFYHNSLLMLFIPNQFWIVKSLITVKNYPLVFSLLFGVVAFIFSSKSTRFFLLWVFITLLPTQVFSGVAARYLYLPSVGMAVFFASAIVKMTQMLSDKFAKKNPDNIERVETVDKSKEIISLLFSFMILLAIVAPGISFINDRKEEWHNSSITVKNIISGANINLSDSSGKRLFFVNIPDSRQSANSFFPAYILRNGFREALKLSDKNQAYSLKLLKLKNTPWQCVYESEITLEDLKSLLPDPRNMVFAFDPAKNTIIQITKL